MSYDLAVWYPSRRISHSEAGAIYIELCEDEGDVDVLEPNSEIDAFYDELYSVHPELNDVPDDRVDDSDYCPWSINHDRSDRHMIIASVWSQAEHVHELIHRLARKHGLAVYDPQEDLITYPDGPVNIAEKPGPWWKFWA